MHRAQAHTRDWRSVENDLLRQALASFLIQAALVTERFRDKTIGRDSRVHVVEFSHSLSGRLFLRHCSGQVNASNVIFCNYSGLNQYFPRNAPFLPPSGEGMARFALEKWMA
jgi:hypothetical protein